MKDSDGDIFSKFPKEYVGLVGVAFGVLFLLGAILNWDWILQGDGRIMNIAWVSDMFGRNVARILVGITAIVIIILGVVIFCLMKK